MPSSITLTVSHLPTSTSFFLSALQPLNYAYRGRSNNTIGFGSSTDPSAPADFWITQEVPGVPAGAAHVAFSAPSRVAVQHFFTAALKAGGKFHGDPAVRDSSGYYSAAVIDFDGNSIEAVHRPTYSDDKENDARSSVSNARSMAKSQAQSVARSSVSRAAPTEVSARSSVSRAAPSEVRSRVSRAPTLAPAQPTTQPRPSADVFESLIAEARNAASVAREVVAKARADQTTSTGGGGGSGGAGDTIMGTLLGVAAGAAISYAFTSRDRTETTYRPAAPARSATDPSPPTQYQDYRAIEPMPAPSEYYSHSPPRAITLEDNEYASTVRSSRTHHRRRNSVSTGFGNDSRAGGGAESRVSRHTDAPGGSTASRSSRRSAMRMIEGPPAPTASTHFTKASSSRRNGGGNSSVADPLLVPIPASVARSSRSERSGATTVIRATTEETVQARLAMAASTVSRGPPPSSAAQSRRASALGSAKQANEYPLPPSKANTWALGGSTLSKAASHKSASRASKAPSAASQRKFDREVTPDDSVSQISVGTARAGSRR